MMAAVTHRSWASPRVEHCGRNSFQMKSTVFLKESQKNFGSRTFADVTASEAPRQGVTEAPCHFRNCSTTLSRASLVLRKALLATMYRRCMLSIRKFVWSQQPTMAGGLFSLGQHLPVFSSSPPSALDAEHCRLAPGSVVRAVLHSRRV